MGGGGGVEQQPAPGLAQKSASSLPSQVWQQGQAEQLGTPQVKHEAPYSGQGWAIMGQV